MKAFALKGGLLALGLLGAAACQKPAADLREWQPHDHSNTTNPAAQAKQSDGKAAPAPAGLDEVTIATWSAKCVQCHGRIGKGDGPQAPMYQPRDLTDPTWQASATDGRIAEVIQKGFGKMPGFALPEPTLSNMVQLIRRLNSSPAAPGPASASTTTASRPVASSRPGTSAAPARSSSPHP